MDPEIYNFFKSLKKLYFKKTGYKLENNKIINKHGWDIDKPDDFDQLYNSYYQIVLR